MRLLDDALISELIELRRDLHRNPELAFEEHRTARVIAERLREAGVAVQEGIAGTGVVGTLDFGRPGPTLMLRAELDALPVTEKTGLPFASTVDGVHHACGHDAHMAIVATVAKYLAANPGGLQGRVRFVFQPAEEVVGGAARMVDAGVLDDPPVDALIVQHMHAHINAGVIGIARGSACASVSDFTLTVHGAGGHGAFPHASVDPIVAGAHIITALQTIASREISALDRAVLSVCQLTAGNAHNIIPDTATMVGTIRTATAETHAHLQRRCREIAEGVAGSLRCTIDFQPSSVLPPVVNDDVLGSLVTEVAREVAGEDSMVVPDPVMAGDDAAWYFQRVPGVYCFIGGAYTDGRPQTPHHSPEFDVDEEAVKLGAEVVTDAAIRYLGADHPPSLK